MIDYLLRRVLLAVPILMFVNLLTFVLFFVVNSPDDMARMHLGERHVTSEMVQKWKAERGYAKPLLWNADAGGLSALTETIFFEHSRRLFTLQFGHSDGGRDIRYDLSERLGPSFAISLPVLFLELWLSVALGLLLALHHATALARLGNLVSVAAISISSLFFIIAGQYLIAKLLLLVPVSGYREGFAGWKFLVLPIAIQVMASLGANVRLNRAFFLEEINRDHVRTARAKGLSERRVLTHHVLRNSMLPLVTTVIVSLPGLFLGSLITESFFAIPGLGSYTIDAIQNQDFAIVRAMVFIGTLLFIVSLLITDILYAWVDPRVRFDAQ